MMRIVCALFVLAVDAFFSIVLFPHPKTEAKTTSENQHGLIGVKVLSMFCFSFVLVYSASFFRLCYFPTHPRGQKPLYIIAKTHNTPIGAKMVSIICAG